MTEACSAMRWLLPCVVVFFMISAEGCQTLRKAQPSMKTTVFGKLQDGREVHQYTLSNGAGLTAEVINYGATIASLSVPDRNRKVDDVVLGYDTLEGYVNGTAYFGAIVGRYGNRVGRGQFQLDGKRHQLTVNDGENHLHGGKIGFNKVLWDAKKPDNTADSSIRMQYVSRDGEEGYPGTVTIVVTYTLTDRNELRIDYEGTTDQPTILNPTQHSYFNLSGAFTNTILAHQLMIEADGITAVDKGLIPTGQIANVANTPMDFRAPVAIGSHINDNDEQLAFGKGYDHNWVLKGNPGRVRKAAELYDDASGRLMSVFTDQPGIQFYSGNFLDGSEKGKKGIAYQQRSGLCLEAQAFPDTPNKPQFPSIALWPGKTYRQTTIYQFSTK
jgi:aldose 1-epimerase